MCLFICSLLKFPNSTYLACSSAIAISFSCPIPSNLNENWRDGRLLKKRKVSIFCWNTFVMCCMGTPKTEKGVFGTSWSANSRLMKGNYWASRFYRVRVEGFITAGVGCSMTRSFVITNGCFSGTLTADTFWFSWSWQWSCSCIGTW